MKKVIVRQGDIFQADISQVSLKAYFFGAICPVGMFFVPTGQLAPKKHALRLTWEMSAWEMYPCPKYSIHVKIKKCTRGGGDKSPRQGKIDCYSAITINFSLARTFAP